MFKKSLLLMLLMALMAPWAAKGQQSLPLQDDFESYSTGNTPTGWTTQAGTVNVQKEYPHAGTKALRFSGSAGTNTAMVLLPQMTIPNGTTITFYTCPEDKTKSGSFALGYYKDAAFTSLFTYNGSDFTAAKTHEQKTETLNNIPDGACLAFSQSPQTGSWYWYVDDIAIYTYPQPTNLTYDNATQTSVELSWNAANSETSWNVQYKKSSDTEWQVKNNVTTRTSYVLSPLESGKTYNVRVQANISGALWSETVNPRTDCGAVSITPNAFEYGFENADDFECWTKENFYTSSYSNTGIVSGNARTGSYSFLFYQNSSDTPQTMITPQLITTNKGVRVAFYYKQSSSGSYYYQKFKVGYSTNGTDYTWDDIVTTSSNSYNLYQHDFTTSDIQYIAIQWIRNTGAGYGNLYIDDITISEAPSCLEPTNLTKGTITPHTAVLSWTKQGTAESWDISYGTTTGDHSTTKNVTTSDVTISGNTVTYTLGDNDGVTLNGETTYYVSVRSHCADGDGNQSEWSNEVNFTTGVACTAPGQPNAATGITRTSASITWTDADHDAWSLCYSSTTSTRPGKDVTVTTGNYTVVNNLTEASYLFDNVLTAGTTYYVWVRANCGDVDGLSQWCTNYRSFATVGYPAPAMPSVIPTPNGAVVTWDPAYDETKWRVRWKQYTHNTEWTVIGENEPLTERTCTITEMYSDEYSYVQVMAVYDAQDSDWSTSKTFYTLAACPVPTLNAIDEATIGTTSVVISWIKGYEETQWQLQYKLNSANSWSDDNISEPFDDNNGTFTHTLDGLTAATKYDVRLRSYCDSESQSAWSEKQTFTTDCELANLPKFYNFDSFTAGSSAAFPICWDRIKNGSYPYIYASYAYSGSNCVDFYMSSSVDEILIFPEINIASYPMDNTQVRFMARTYNSENKVLSVGVMTDPADATTYTEVGQVTVANSTYAEYKVRFDSYEGTFTNEQSYIAIKLIGTGDYVLVDDVNIEVIPSCTKPTAFANTEVTENTAKFTWTKGYDEAAWQIAYSETQDFFNVPAAVIYTVDVAEAELNEGVYTLTNTNAHPLVAETTYYARIRSHCGENNNSEWNDDEVMFKPTAAQTKTIYDLSNTNSYVPIEMGNADYALKCEYIIPATEIAVMSGKNITQMTFYTNGSFNSGTGSFQVFMKEVGETSTLSGFLGTEGSTTVYTGAVSTNSDNELTIEFTNEFSYYGNNLLIGFYKEKGGSYESSRAFKGSSDVSSNAWQGNGGSYGTLSSITGSSKSFGPKTTFTYLPNPYPAPMNLAASNVEATTATLSWNAAPGSEPTKYQYRYKAGEGGFTEWADASASPVELENLTPETEYTFNLRAVYGNENSSVVSTTFTTKEACPAPTNLHLVSRPAEHPSWLELAWTAGGTETSWKVYYKESTGSWDTPADVTTATVTSATYTIEGAFSKTYDVRVTAISGEDESAPVSGSFSTPIEVSSATAFTEGFDGTTIPTGWTSLEDGYYLWLFNGEARSDDRGGTNGIYLITPLLYLNDVTPQIEFKQKKVKPSVSGIYDNGTISVLVSTTGIDRSDFTSVWSSNTSSLTTNYTNNTFTLSDYANQSVYIAFKFEASYKNYRWFIDDVNITIENTFTTAGDWNTADNWSAGTVPTQTDDVYINADATISSETIATANKITVATGKTITIEDGGQLKSSNAVTATFVKNIEAATDGFDENWYLLSSPIGNVSTENVTNLLTGTEGHAYNLYCFDEPTAFWKGNVHFTTFNQGRGYLYRNNNGDDISFTGPTKVGNITDYSLTYTSESPADHLRGFNLIGNPYAHNITRSCITLSNDAVFTGFYKLATTGAWISEVESEIKPGEGFFVQVNKETTATFHETAPSKDRNNNDYIRFVVSNSQYEDVTYALFDKGNGLNKLNHRNAEVPMVYIPKNGEKFAIAMMDDNIETFDLSFKSATTGKYTLSFDTKGDFSYLHVIDRMTGEDVDMLLDGEYSFISSPADNVNRFIVKLKYNASYTTDDSFAYQSGDELIINGDGTLQVYDVMGRLVETMEINGNKRISASTFNTGVCVLRLVGSNVKTQKIVVK